MKLPERIEDILRTRYPWLATDFNGATWESKTQQQERRIHALEEHINDLEGRYGALESRLNSHANGQTHRSPKNRLPIPDEES